MSLPAFGVRHPVVANLAMAAIVGAGIIFGLSLTREFFPEVRANQVLITAPYPGAAPDEVEDALAVKIEDQLADITEIKEIATTVSEGLCVVAVEYEDGTDIDAAVAEIKREVDALQDLPDAADRIVVTKLEPNLPAIVVSLYGDNDEREMKVAARRVRDDLRSLPGMGNITIGGIRNDEVTVEVRPEALLAHNLSLDAVARRINAAMIELPAGSVRTATANLALRSVGIEERAQFIRDIVIKADQDSGRVLRLSDVATVRDGFADVPISSRLNGQRSVDMTVFKEGDQDIVTMAEMVKAYVAGRNGEPLTLTPLERLASLATPPGSGAAPSSRVAAYRLGESRRSEALPGTLTTTTDLARYVTGRLELLTTNAFQGGVLVFLTLVLLMNWRMSFWVTAGMVISLIGSLAFMRFAGITLNLLSMFGLIIVVGILVDDAIVVAENITSRHEKGEPALSAAINGAGEVGWPVVATVLTTIVAFLPLALIGGTIGDLMASLPIVVTCALTVSLFESVFILPSHMAHSLRKADIKKAQGREGWFARFEKKLEAARAHLFNNIIGNALARALTFVTRAPYTTLAVAVAAVIASVAQIAGGRLEFVFFEANDAETLNIELEMPVGTPLVQTDAVLRRIEAAVDAQPEVKSYFTSVGSVGSLNNAGSSDATSAGQLILELRPVEERPDRSSEDVTNAIRAAIGPLTGIKSLKVSGVAGGPDGPALNYTLVAEDPAKLEAAAAWFEERIARFDGVVDLANSSTKGLREVRFDLRDGAAELGFTRADLGRQIQGFVFGIEAFTFAGNQEDVDVRVLLPEATRRSLAAIERQHVFTAAGTPVPLAEVADIQEAEAYASLRRFGERTRPRRSVSITADVNRASGANPENIAAELNDDIAELKQTFAGVDVIPRGRQKDVADAFATLPIGFLTAAGLIYLCLAWLFNSYTQPLVVMTAIPFSIVGVVWGHIGVGYLTQGKPYTMTFLSLIGFVALAGIVVNDSLVFIEFFNDQRKKGLTVVDACIATGRARVRAILLTTITTVLGLTPLMLERSFQARFLIPMAITIACGLAFATLTTLLVLPALLVVLRDLGALATTLWTGRPAPKDRPYHDPAAEVIPSAH